MSSSRTLCLILVVSTVGRLGGAESSDAHGPVLGAGGGGRGGAFGSKEDDGTLAMVEVGSHLAAEVEAMPNPGEPVYPWDTIHLQFDQCHAGPAYARAAPANVHLLSNAEKCGLCQVIVENSMMWNWKRHLSALCSRVPRHMLPLCRHFSCLMSIECPEFITGKCFEDGIERFPCPAKYVCWNCLKLPDRQYAGCFDNRNIPYWLTNG